MQHLTVESKDLLIGDEAADLLTRYAAVIAEQSGGDRISLHCISSDGDEVTATIVLSGGTTLLVESTHTTLPEPDNAEAIAYMRKQIDLATSPPAVKPAAKDEVASWERQFDDL